MPIPASDDCISPGTKLCDLDIGNAILAYSYAICASGMQFSHFGGKPASKSSVFWMWETHPPLNGG